MHRTSTFFACLAVFVLLLASAVANVFFFPLKPIMHWDELVRYAFQGVELPSYSLFRVLSALGGLDNGRTVVFALRFLRTLLPQLSVDAILLVYKNLVLAFNFGAVFFFGRVFFGHTERRFGAWALAFVALAPMFWIQANEVMCEPLAMPLSLLWFLCLHEVLWFDRRLGLSTWATWGILAFTTALFVLTSFQFFLIYGALTGLCITLLCLFNLPRASFVERARPALIAGLVCAAALLFWITTRFHHSIALRLEYVRHLLAVSSFSFNDALIAGMTAYDVFFFGLRTFAWLYFPPLLLLIPAIFELVRRWRDFPIRIRFLILFAVLQVPLYAHGYRKCIQERYFHLPNTIVLLVVAYGLWKAVQRFRAHSVLAQYALGAVVGIYAIFEYGPLYQKLPCFGNLQIYGPYVETSGTCENVRTLFGLMNREQWVRYPHLKTAYYFPHTRPGVLKLPLEVLANTEALLEKGFYPRTLPVTPNYFSQRFLELAYIKKFKEPVPDAKGPSLLISLSFPESSPYNSRIYSVLEEQSEAKALALWKEEVEAKAHTLIVEKRTPDFTLLAAKIF